MFSLDLLARWYGTDKAHGQHGYTGLYAEHLKHRRLEKLSILEIGVGGQDTNSGGPSLRMWRTFFPRASVVGVDLYEKRLPKEARITILQGDQSDVRFLEVLVAGHGPFDLVVDDGSHRGEDINLTFEAIWPSLRAGGLYVIEDISTSFDPAYGGGPPGTARTAISLIKTLVDGLHGNGPDRAASVHVYPDIAFIEKPS